MTTSPFDVKLVEVGFRGLSGSPGIVPRGAWLNTTVYVRNDVVTYLGASWRALAGSTGVAPDSDAGKWEVFVQRGAQGPSFAPGEAIIVFVDGQSNAVLRRAFSWSPPPNLWEWNNNGGAMTLGTAWVKPDGTIISWPLAIGAEIARRFPANPVYILTEARGSSAMVHWLPGIPYTWSSSTSVADPGTGKIAINNATPGSATTLSVSETASDGKFRYYWLFSLLLNTGRIRVSKASDPTVYVEYTKASAYTDDVNFWSQPLTYYATGGGGAPANGDAVLLTSPTADMWAQTTADVPTALAAIGETQISMHYHWQGENEVIANYVHGDKTDLFARYETQSWYPANTPQMLSAIRSSLISGHDNDRLINNEILRFVQDNPTRRLFTYPGFLPVDPDWDNTTNNPIHLTAVGQVVSGTIAAQQSLGQNSYAVSRSALADTENGRTYFKNGSVTLPGISFEGDPTTGLYPDGAATLAWGALGTGYFRTTVTGIYFGAGADSSKVGSPLRTRKVGSLTSVWAQEGENTVAVQARRHSADTTGPQVQLIKGRGTLDAPAAVQQNDILGNFDFVGHGATGDFNGARIQGKVIEATPSDTAMGSQLDLQVTAAGANFATSILTLLHGSGMLFENAIIYDPNRHRRDRIYLRQTLPTPSANNIGWADVSNQESGKSRSVYNTGAAWLYQDGSTVTLT